MENENWKPVVGFEGSYEVSDKGRVFSLLRKKILKPNTSSTGGYCRIILQKDSKSKNVKSHILVLEAFVGERPKGYDAAHLNGKVTDNRVENLRWVTSKENNMHRRLHGTLPMGEKCWNSKFTKEDVLRMRYLYNVEGRGAASIYKEYNYVRWNSVWEVLINKTWKHILPK